MQPFPNQETRTADASRALAPRGQSGAPGLLCAPPARGLACPPPALLQSLDPISSLPASAPHWAPGHTCFASRHHPEHSGVSPGAAVGRKARGQILRAHRQGNSPLPSPHPTVPVPRRRGGRLPLTTCPGGPQGHKGEPTAGGVWGVSWREQDTQRGP